MRFTVDDKMWLRKNGAFLYLETVDLPEKRPPSHSRIIPPQNNKGCSFYDFILREYSEGEPFLEAELDEVEKIKCRPHVLFLAWLYCEWF